MKRLLSIISFMLYCGIAVFGEDLYFKHIGTIDGLSQVCTESIWQDELGAVWIGTPEGLNRFNGKDTRSFSLSSFEEGITNNPITKITGDRKGHLYILSGKNLVMLDLYKERFHVLKRDNVRTFCCHNGTLWIGSDDGIYKYNPGEELTKACTIPCRSAYADMCAEGDTLYIASRTELKAVSIKDPEKHREVLSYSMGNCVFMDSSSNLWVGTWDGLFKIGRDGSCKLLKSSQGTISDNQVRAVLEDDMHRIWIGTFRGLDMYDPLADRWEHYTRSGPTSNTLSHNSILCLHKDMHGSIWVGTYYGGVNVFNPDSDNDHFFMSEPLSDSSLSFAVTGKMTEDGNGNLWVCTEGGGLNKYVAQTGVFSRFVHQNGNNASIGDNNLKSIYYNKENGLLYIGTHLGGLYVMNPASGIGHVLHHDKNNPFSLPHEIINDIQPYHNGLAMLTQGGPVLMDTKTERFRPLVEDEDIQKKINREFQWETFLIDHRDRMWLASTSNGIVCVDLLTSRMTRYKEGLPGISKVVNIYEDSYGNIWFCTLGSGILKFREKQGDFEAYDARNGALPDNYCYFITDGRVKDELFLLNSKGFSVFDIRSGHVQYTRQLFHQTYAQGSAIYRSRSGNVYVSGTNGLSSFREKTLDNNVENRLQYDKLWIFNDEIVPGDDTGILEQILAKTDRINLKYRQNNVTLEFINLYFSDKPKKITYEYFLEGYDEGWTQTAGTSATYTKLKPGTYKLRVRASGEPASEISMSIHVSAPIYATGLAYLLYLSLAFFIVLLLFRFYIRQVKLKQSIAYERKEKEYIEKLNDEKLRFFMNISQEFISPLTLIIGQLEILMQKEELIPSIQKKVSRIHKNAWYMRNLVTELLDFRKHEQGCLKLKVKECNLVSFTKQVFVSFQEYSQKNGIPYRFDSSDGSIMVWIDPIQLQKVIFNLISNVFKYSLPGQGSISVEVLRASDSAIISVSYYGAEITDEELDKIFNGYFHDNDGKQSEISSAGISLSLSKSIIDMHHGKFEVQEEPEKGNRFLITLPLGNRHFSVEELTGNSQEKAYIIDIPQVDFIDVNNQDIEDGQYQEEDTAVSDLHSRPVVLAIDDNEDMLTMLKDILSPNYTVHVARGGQEGLDKAGSLIPDLVICNAMLSGISGKNLCTKIKNNISLSKTSVVLIMPQDTPNYMVEGFMSGADDCIAKPFDVKVLLARCDNIIRNKLRLESYFGSHPIQAPDTVGVISDHDRQWMDRCTKIVKSNLENPNFNVMSLASELCISRSKLYSRFKQLMGQNPNEFINKIKLNEAMDMLKKSPELNISEISVRLGFSSPRYFSRAFKAFFGIAPQTVRNKK